ncbi:MAG TPA: dTMP kinase [Myxococcota bacterium]|nr:dTMP kinase [Myxococcota bacterium]
MGRAPRVNRGRLVALEGLDGSGKSTQVPALVAALRARGHDVVATREPTDSEFGRRIRAMARSGELVAPDEELRWFVEDRRDHVARVIAPAIAAGQCVLTDRYYLSTVAYQGARGLDWRSILAASEAEFPIPDLALVFEIAPEQGLLRVGARLGTAAEPAFERADYLARVGEILAAIDRDYIVRIDASGSVESVREKAVAALGSLR